MPPAATLLYPSSSIEELIVGFEVEAIDSSDDEHDAGDLSAVRTRIFVADDGSSDSEEETGNPPAGLPDVNPAKCGIDSRYDFLAVATPGGKSLVDSFDSLDEIKEGSNEARLLKTLAEKALVSREGSAVNMSNPQDAFFLDESEANMYLDVLDRHLEQTDPECINISELDSGPDDPHPSKNEASVEAILEHFLDEACCECSDDVTKPLKSVLRPPKRAAGIAKIDPVPEDMPRTRSVKFQNLDIREFKMTLGNHPSATSGPPVMLDWDSRPQSHVVSLEAYERARQPRRNRRQLKLSLQERHGILVRDQGFSFEAVKSAWQEALEIRRQRKETLERGLALMKWDEVWESTCRKFNRLVDV